jgi:hypothetical protein
MAKRKHEPSLHGPCSTLVASKSYLRLPCGLSRLVRPQAEAADSPLGTEHGKAIRLRQLLQDRVLLDELRYAISYKC